MGDRRRVFGDITNQLGNRGFSLVTRKPAPKPFSGVKRSVENMDVDSHSCRKILRNEVRFSPLKGGKTYRLQSSSGHMGYLDVVEVKKQSCSGLDRDLVSAVNVESTAQDAGDDCMTSCRFTESQETPSFGLERCKLVKGYGSDCFDAGIDLLKNCCCSFCTKAAYIWSDLQCQDVKGRISTLAKSRRETSNLAQRYSKESPMQRNFCTAPHLETDLTTLWSSHFLHMDTIFAAETTQLESNLAVLKDLREGYKMNLEMINALPPNMQQCTSDDASHHHIIS